MIVSRPTRLTVSSRAGAAFSLVLAVAILAGSVPARAEDDEVPLDSKILRGLLEAIGLRRDGEGINYQERAPLVIPPSRALPPPEKSGAAIANNPAWPKDPDVLRAKEEAARERNSIRSADEQMREAEKLMTEAEMTPGMKPSDRRRAARRAGTGGAAGLSSEGIGDKLSSSQLGYKGGLFSNMFAPDKEEVARFTGEPPRTSLTEPPPGYQTPSPDQPYGVGAKASAPKAEDYTTKHGEYQQ
ncbi:MAG: hypothetical protein K9G60_10270 [Pseudolabrys sp.]|nr:hypothetical protein [Pseudolabrys sp.]